MLMYSSVYALKMLMYNTHIAAKKPVILQRVYQPDKKIFSQEQPRIPCVPI